MKALFNFLFWLLIGILLFSKIISGTIGVVKKIVGDDTNKKSETEITKTSFSILHHFLKSDSISIDKQFAVSDRKLVKQKKISRDCRNLQIIVEKHGYPKLNEASLSKGDFDQAQVWIKLIDKPDTVLNIKSVYLLVTFYPYPYLEDTNQFIDYDVVIDPIEDPMWMHSYKRDSLLIQF